MLLSCYAHPPVCVYSSEELFSLSVSFSLWILALIIVPSLEKIVCIPYFSVFFSTRKSIAILLRTVPYKNIYVVKEKHRSVSLY